MASSDEAAVRASQVLDREEIETVLSGAFYAPDSAVDRHERTGTHTSEKPLHYKVICISLYNQDLEDLDRMVAQLKARGMTKANRSALIRFALAQVDLDKVPRGL